VRIKSFQADGALALAGHIMEGILGLDNRRRMLAQDDPITNALLADIQAQAMFHGQEDPSAALRRVEHVMSIPEMILLSIGIGLVIGVGFILFFMWTLGFAERQSPLRRMHQAKREIDVVVGHAAADMDELFERPRPRKTARDDFRLKQSGWSA
jgi:hypothetical protein